MTSTDLPRPSLSLRKGKRILLSTTLAIGLGLTLAGCKTTEEKADEYYQSGLDLLDQGDTDRAIVQFRNVFNIDGTHYESRRKLAEVLLQQNKAREAYSQYLRLAEQYPDDLTTRVALSRLALEGGQAEEFDRHLAQAVTLDPENAEVRALDLVRKYRDAARAEDDATRDGLADEARTLADTRPDDTALLGILLDDAARQRDTQTADRLTAHLLKLQPENQMRWRQRLALLLEKGDMPAVEEHLKAAAAKFPDNDDVKADLLRFYLSERRPDDAEAFLRQMADAAPADQPGPRVDLIRFIEAQKGPEAARTELTRFRTAAGADPLIFEVLDAGFDYREGKQDEAVARIRKVLEGVTEPSDRSRDVKVQLARMLQGQGDEEGARAQITDVLAQNPAHPGALKIQAAWDIETDNTDNAVLSLRSVLDQQPQDAEAMTLMANAYWRAGEPELARDYLSQAAQASGNAPAETLRLAQALMENGNHRPAEDALLPALRKAPDNLELLEMLGRVYLAMPDLPRAEGVVSRLREIDDPRAKAIGDQLELNRVAAADGQEAAMGYLQELAQQNGTAGGTSVAARVELIRARLSSGDTEAALKMAQDLLTEQPESRPAQMTMAMTEAASGDTDAAAKRLNDMIAAAPDEIQPYMALIRLVSQTGTPDETMAVVDRGLTAVPGNADLLWTKSGLLERKGDIDGAIAIYEDLYAQNSGSVIVANNLASLLSTWRANDPEAVKRASAVARRLKDTDVPAFMDTYGWIQHLNGDSLAGLPYLEGAAAGLADDAMVQIHLGLVQEAVGKSDAAKAQLTKALAMLAADAEGSSVTLARETLARLENPAAPAADTAADATPAATTSAPAN